MANKILGCLEDCFYGCLSFCFAILAGIFFVFISMCLLAAFIPHPNIRKVNDVEKLILPSEFSVTVNPGIISGMPTNIYFSKKLKMMLMENNGVNIFSDCNKNTTVICTNKEKFPTWIHKNITDNCAVHKGAYCEFDDFDWNDAGANMPVGECDDLNGNVGTSYYFNNNFVCFSKNKPLYASVNGYIYYFSNFTDKIDYSKFDLNNICN